MQYDADMEILNEEAKAIEDKKLANRERIIAQKVELSEKTKGNASDKKELEGLKEANEKLIKDNTTLNEKNDKLDSEIKDLLQRI